jgi:DNA-binding NarL/FixJ family response regulator
MWVGIPKRAEMTLAQGPEIFSESEWVELVRDLCLPPRQAEVAKHLLLGQSDKQIAIAMQISVAAVRAHLSRLFSKFGLQDRTELILYMFIHFRRKCHANECHHI